MNSEFVFRFAVVVKPTKDNSRYYEWQTLDIVLFVGDLDGQSAESRVKSFLNKNKFRIIEFAIRDRLIEDRVKADNNVDFISKYMTAKDGNVIIAFQRVREFFSDKKHPPMLFPSLDESFFDRVISRVNGIRLPTDDTEKNGIKNADYLVEDYIIELKFLLQDPFETNEARISKLFEKYKFKGAIDPEILSDEDKKEFDDIIMKPLSTHVQKASKQIKSVKQYLNKNNFHGFLLLVNQSATALWNNTDKLLERTISRHSDTIENHLTVELLHRTNGMDTNIEYAIYPEKKQTNIQKILIESFDKEFEMLMNEFARNSFQTDNPLQIAHDKVIGSNGELHSGFQELDNPYLK